MADAGSEEKLYKKKTGEDVKPENITENASDKKAEPACKNSGIRDFDGLLAEKQALADDYRDRLIRMQADFENYKKRAAREKEDFMRVAGEGIVRSQISVYEDLERAIASARQAADNASNSEEGAIASNELLKGLEMIQASFWQTLADAGLCAMEAAGCKFDPYKHEAIAQDSNAELPDGQVTDEVQRGYILNGKVLRPAKVKVNVNKAKKGNGQAAQSGATEKADEGSPGSDVRAGQNEGASQPQSGELGAENDN